MNFVLGNRSLFEQSYHFLLFILVASFKFRFFACLFIFIFFSLKKIGNNNVVFQKNFRSKQHEQLML